MGLGTAALGTPQIALVFGEAGIGKTSLVREVGARATDQGRIVLRGHCLDIETGGRWPGPRGAVPLVHRSSGRIASASDMSTCALPAGHVPFGDVSSATLAEDLPLVLGELGEVVPLLLVQEDMHWAESRTRTSLSDWPGPSAGGCWSC